MAEKVQGISPGAFLFTKRIETLLDLLYLLVAALTGEQFAQVQL